MELISEPIDPEPGSIDAARMAKGEPGLPGAFTWRGRRYQVQAELLAWKESSREGSSAQGELYLRRHCFRIQVDDGSTWTIYCLRQTPKSGSAKRRWFLYTIDSGK